MAKAKSFEEMIEELEKILTEMEQGEMPLAEMMKLYNKGIRLVGSCQTRLQAAQEKIDTQGGGK
jgi:exodeoxyribonuclease VII small subunit